MSRLNVPGREQSPTASKPLLGDLSAHTYLGLNVAKLDGTEVRRNRQGHSGDVKAHAAVVFARRVAESRGRLAAQP